MSTVAPETPTRAAGTAGAAATAAPTRLPAPIPGDRPTHRVPFLRLVRVELRKMLDTRAGRWLLIAIGVVIAAALVIMFATDGGEHPYGDYLQATTMPMAMLLPLVGILAVTSEWSQRTALVTFALEARRVRVAWAKVVAAMLVGVGAVAFSLALGTAAHAGAIAFRGIEGDWTMSGLALAGAAGYVLLGLAQGLGFGMLLRNTPAAIVLFFVLPTAWSVLSSMVSWVERAGAWLDMNRTMQPLFTGSLTGEQWAQLGTSVGVWVALPLALGMWRLTRAEVK
ncbi:MAG TPA: ABC transporter permease [Phycicoccus sp.]|nr:ABC transporter permease [Phycicoccus sp.]